MIELIQEGNQPFRSAVRAKKGKPMQRAMERRSEGEISREER
jgi:hypothetical protein